MTAHKHSDDICLMDGPMDPGKNSPQDTGRATRQNIAKTSVICQSAAMALAHHASMLSAPLADLGCVMMGQSGTALRAGGFSCIDGYCLSPTAQEHLSARQTPYRKLAHIDLGQSLHDLGGDIYQNIAAIEVLEPDIHKPSVLDEILFHLPTGGCLVYTLDQPVAVHGCFNARLCDLIEYGVCDLLHRNYCPYLPEPKSGAWVFVLRKR